MLNLARSGIHHCSLIAGLVVVKVLIIIVRHLNYLRTIILLSTTRHFGYNAVLAFYLLAIADYSLHYIVRCVFWFVQDKCITFSSPIAPPFTAVPHTHVCTRGYIVSAIDQYRGHLKCFIYGRFIIFSRNY